MGKAQVAVATPPPAAQEKRDVIFIERPGQKDIPKKVGREPYMAAADAESPETKKFLSYYKDMVVYKGNELAIHFQNRMYITNHQEDINFLRSHRAFGDGFWEGKYPKEVVSKMEKELELVYHDDDIFTNPD